MDVLTCSRDCRGSLPCRKELAVERCRIVLLNLATAKGSHGSRTQYDDLV